MIMIDSWCVYKHTSPSGKVYIGIAKDVKHRWRNKGNGYRGSTRFANAIKKYGWDNFKHEIIFEGLDKETACKKEIELIGFYDSTCPDKGYNLLSGGQCGKHTTETKEKIRNANLGHEVSEKSRKLISEARSIPIICLETKIIYKSAKQASEKMNIYYGSIVKVCLGKAERAGGFHFAKLEDYNNGNIPVFVGSRKNKKRVLCVSTGEIFDSETHAAKKYGVTSQAISHACTGKVSTCCGLLWKNL